MKPLVILGSARSDGHTRAAINLVFQGDSVELVDLNHLTIEDFTYENIPQDDDFLPLVEKMLQHDIVILASPVYWYTMSAVMKRFIDRWTDLLHKQKHLGQALKGKNIAVITSYGTPPFETQGFEVCFKNIAKYMHLNYLCCFPHFSGRDEALSKENSPKAQDFKKLITKLA